MITAHCLGFPRIGCSRQMKFAVESYWKGTLSETELLAVGRRIRQENWQMQSQAGLHWVTVGDFSWYDHMLDMSMTLGVIPDRFADVGTELATCFAMARGCSSADKPITACEMTKWFNTNYHYIVPEFSPHQSFVVNTSRLFAEIDEAEAHHYPVKVVMPGPLSYLWLGKTYPAFDKLTLLPALLDAYQHLLSALSTKNVSWVQLDEPILVLDLPLAWQHAFMQAYDSLQPEGCKLMLTTYFGGMEENGDWVCRLPVSGLHVDAVTAPEQVKSLMQRLQPNTCLSVGIVNGRNIWKTDLMKARQFLEPLYEQLQSRLWIGGSCSFLHSPMDLDLETSLDLKVKSWLAFTKQKCLELASLARGFNEGWDEIKAVLADNQHVMQQKQTSSLIHNPGVQARLHTLDDLNTERAPYPERQAAQQRAMPLPILPTTTIGSFPQTPEIRRLRHDFKQDRISLIDYENGLKEVIRDVIHRQDALGLDVLVHGEAERADMVEYFGDQLQGFAATEHGWVQSYGSRCVKPPVIYGDVSRPETMTVPWSRYAQSLTNKPVKGMLTGPITILMWSFVRDDQPMRDTARQLALALRDEVMDLEQAGIRVIQIDEPAFREGLPLRRRHWEEYLAEAVRCFKLTAGGVKETTQIHTHMCYSEFNDVIEAIAALDADVISIETSRSNMELLDAFKHFSYPNAIGPGVYDIHSPRIPSVQEMMHLIDRAAALIPVERLWVNPDCGLKTRGWPEVNTALANMVEAAKRVRQQFLNSR
ncbi:5-methyltetrahydropteroyltriglutamate--homocysteine methyltransferase [Legionella rubrilucens]|uniref:5-methyltetrahydropteroyltriglutamate--homocysteine methyltransferase n=1 Tax=Legionella rubrilucens TaxID=458 RepID=A0A0W0XWD7_9GAMM|nr:5-methyltetrahydropteroyltriglutamate--homocysteine S-methyltransferase [Legionella rubrilucens]KTD49079.1 5-methyltetrahydropteroyltriglutamate--homocysteine methyltransferase [Legionella rubrilucens]